MLIAIVNSYHSRQVGLSVVLASKWLGKG